MGAFKMRISKIISIILILIVSVACISGCGSSNEKSIVGQWYNEKGKCLDIRSDGTWKLDDSYGTGTYKLLDDKETFEFTDFYGDTQESKINTDDLGQYIDFGYYGDFYKDSYPSSTNSSIEKNNVSSNECTVEAVYVYGEKTAWVSYNNESEKSYSLISTNGKILYSVDKNNELNNEIRPYKFFEMSGGLSYYGTTDSQGKIVDYYLVNSDGEMIASSKNGDFDSVVCYGDGLALVYKCNSNMQSAEHLYGIIDKNGSWKFPLTNFKQEPRYENYEINISYVGDGMFAIGVEAKSYLFLNSNNGTYFYIYNTDNWSAKDFNFNYGSAYVYAEWVTSPIISKMPPDSYRNDENKKEPESSFLIKTDGSYTLINDVIPDYSNYDGAWQLTNGIFVCNESDYLYIYDNSTGKDGQISKYSKKGTKLDFYDDYGLMKTTGEDGKEYFNLICRDGTVCFEPICGATPCFSDECVIYNCNDKYFICDKTGKTMVENLEYNSCLSTNAGIFEMKSGSDTVYIDKNGKEVFNVVQRK